MAFIRTKTSWKCKHCGAEHHTRGRYQTYCNKECGSKYRQSRRLELNPRPQLPTGTTGAMSELAACVDLMLKGYSVFRALSPSCLCDLIAIRDGRTIRVEVRTGAINPSGSLFYSCSPKDKGRSDVIAVVLYYPQRVIYRITGLEDEFDI